MKNLILVLCSMMAMLALAGCDEGSDGDLGGSIDAQKMGLTQQEVIFMQIEDILAEENKLDGQIAQRFEELEDLFVQRDQFNADILSRYQEIEAHIVESEDKEPLGLEAELDKLKELFIYDGAVDADILSKNPKLESRLLEKAEAPSVIGKHRPHRVDKDAFVMSSDDD